MRSLQALAIALAFGLLPTARAQAPAALHVLAAASLQDVLPRILARPGAWPTGSPPPRCTFDASSKLARQIDAGAPADVYIAADEAWMDWLVERHRVDPATRVVVAGNTLVVVVPADARSVPRDARGLGALGRIALAGESVPAGRYAEAALRAGGVWAALQPRVVRGDSVRAALGWVARGEADAAVVYASDARVEPRVRLAFAFPAQSHPPIVYPAAVVRGSAQPAAARALLAALATPGARGLLQEAGFLVGAPR